MSQTKFFPPPTQQNCVAFNLAISTLVNASKTQLLEAMEQLPTNKKQAMAIALLMNSDMAEKTEIFKQLSLEQTGEVTMAIAQVWQEKN